MQPYRINAREFESVANITSQIISQATAAGLEVTGLAGVKAVKTAEELNVAMRSTGDIVAWSAGTPVINAELKPGTRVQMVVTKAQAQAYTGSQGKQVPIGGWATFDDVITQTQARQQLAITNDFKKDVSYVIEYEVVKPIGGNIGFVGHQTNVHGGLQRGGGTQIQFDWSSIPNGASRSDYLRPIDAPKVIPQLLK